MEKEVAKTVLTYVVSEKDNRLDKQAIEKRELAYRKRADDTLRILSMNHALVIKSNRQDDKEPTTDVS